MYKVDGLKMWRIKQRAADRFVTVEAVAESEEKHEAIRERVVRDMKRKNLDAIVEFVTEIPRDPRTGKIRVVEVV